MRKRYAICQALDLDANMNYTKLVPAADKYGINHGVGHFEDMRHAARYAKKAYNDCVFVGFDECSTRFGILPCVVIASILDYENVSLYDDVYELDNIEQD